MKNRRPIVDPFVPMRPQQPQTLTPLPPARPVAATSQPGQSRQSIPKKRRLSLKRITWRPGGKLQFALIIVAAVIAGLLMTIPGGGELVIAVYAVFVFLFKIKSRITFALAGIMIIFVVIMLFIEPSRILATAFATNAFLLLVIGIITLAIEAKHPQKQPTRPGLRIHKDE